MVYLAHWQGGEGQKARASLLSSGKRPGPVGNLRAWHPGIPRIPAWPACLEDAERSVLGAGLGGSPAASFQRARTLLPWLAARPRAHPLGTLAGLPRPLPARGWVGAADPRPAPQPRNPPACAALGDGSAGEEERRRPGSVGAPPLPGPLPGQGRGHGSLFSHARSPARLWDACQVSTDSAGGCLGGKSLLHPREILRPK